MQTRERVVLFAPVLLALIVIVTVSVYNSSPNSQSAQSSSVSNLDTIQQQCVTCKGSMENMIHKEFAVMGGVDLVEYFTEFSKSNGDYDETKKGNKGSPEYAAVYESFIYHFTSAKNRDLFQASPEKYIPQYGGFCSWAISSEMCPHYSWSASCGAPSGSPEHWTIHKEKLYFFHYSTSKLNFLDGLEVNVAKGNDRWAADFGDEYKWTLPHFTSKEDALFTRNDDDPDGNDEDAAAIIATATSQDTVTPSAENIADSSSTTDAGGEQCADCLEDRDFCIDKQTPAIGGVDLVDYFTTYKNKDGSYDESNTGRPGLSTISAVYKGYTFLFRTVKNRDIFLSSPETYVPKYGGFCTWGIVGESCPEYPWSADCLGPSANWHIWTIYEGSLYFFLHDSVKEYFYENAGHYVTYGDRRWAKWGYNNDDNFILTTRCVTDNGGETNLHMEEMEMM